MWRAGISCSTTLVEAFSSAEGCLLTAVEELITQAAVYAAHPRAAYHLSEVIEAHAHATYSAFLEARGDELKHEPVPAVARRSYQCRGKGF